MTRWKTQQIGRDRIQAGVPLRELPSSYDGARGLLLRGVVTATYVVDDPAHPILTLDPNATPLAVYCDVLCYSSMLNQRWQMLKQVLVSQPTGGIHRGRVWKPRASTIDITGEEINLDRATNPANLDGDHVLVGFIDGNSNMPIILRGLPHPANDVGNEGKDAGQRMKLTKVDGDPDFTKHHGAVYGITDAGDFLVDTRQANDGTLDAAGKEPAPPEDGSVGNYIVQLPKGSVLTVEVEGGDNIKLELKDAAAKLTLGNGAVKVAIADHLQTLYGTAKAAFDNHTHSTGVGPSGPPVPTPTFPSWNPSINSNKVLVPDT